VGSLDPDEFEKCVIYLAQIDSPLVPLDYWLAIMSDLQTSTLRSLASSRLERVRIGVAGNMSTPRDLLFTLVSDASERVRIAATRNANADDEIRVAFALVSTPEQVKFSLQSSRTPDQPGTEDASADKPLWLSTGAFLASDSPRWLIDRLAGAGHPAGLLCRDATATTPSMGAAVAFRELVQSGLLMRILWREVALAGRLQVHRDWRGLQVESYDGVRKIRLPEELAGVLGQNLEDWDWMEEEDLVILEDARNWVDEDPGWLEWLTQEFREENLDVLTLGLASGSWSWTQAGNRALRKLRSEVLPLRDWPDIDVESVTIIRGDERFGYALTSAHQKHILVHLLLSARSELNPLASALCTHLLRCVALHPATPRDLLGELMSDPDEDVARAAAWTAERSHEWPGAGLIHGPLAEEWIAGSRRA
jgi:hypothetical protein